MLGHREPKDMRASASRMLRSVSVAVLALFVVGVQGTTASAQTLQQALTQAYRSNAQLDADRARQRAQDEAVAQAMAGYRPTITGSASAGETRTTTEPKSTTQGGETHPRTFGVTATQPIFRGFRTLNNVRLQEATVRAGRETLRNTEQTVLLAAATAYLDVVRDQALVTLNENNVTVLTNQLRATQDQFQVGEVTRTDVAQAQAARANAVAQLELARANLETSRATYERIVGSRPNRLSDAPEPTRIMPKSLDEAISISLRENPLLVNALYLEQAARYNIDLIRGELLPTVQLQGTYAKNYEPAVTLDESETTSVTANVSVPIYQGGEVDSRVRAAKQTQVQRLQLIDQTRSDTQANVIAAWSRLLSARAQGQSAVTQVSASRTALEGVREEYKVGQRTLLDVLNAEQALLQAQTNQVTARHDAVVQAYTLLAAIGRLNAQEAGLGDVVYDPEVNYKEVRRKPWGFEITYPDGRKDSAATWQTETRK